MEFQSEFWFRATQVALKVLPFAFGALLLLPFGVLFWGMIRYQPVPEAEQRAAMDIQAQSSLDEQRTRLLEEDSSSVAGLGIMIVNEDKVGMGLNRLSGGWLTYYPRKWVGVCGLAAIAILFALIAYSAFVPVGPAVDLSSRSESPGESSPMNR